MSYSDNEKESVILTDLIKNRKPLLYYGLPIIPKPNSLDKWILFSPYKQGVLTKEKNATLMEINTDDLLNKKFIKVLNKNGLIGTPIHFVAQDNSKVIRLALFLTDECGMACPYCYGSYGGVRKSNFQYMTTDLTLKIIKKIYKKNPHKLFSIYFIGGEATFNFNVIKTVLNFLDSKKVHYSGRIATHGVIDRGTLDWLIDHNIVLQIGCDGPPEIQAKQKPVVSKKILMGAGSSSEVVERTIKRLVERKTDFMVKSVITNYSVEQMPRIVDYFGKLGVKTLRLEPVSIKGRAHMFSQPTDPKKFVDNFMKALDVAVKYNMKILNWSYAGLYQPRNYFCNFIQNKRFTINPDGTVIFCIEEAGLKNARSKIGLVIEEGDIKINKIKFNGVANYRRDDCTYCKNCYAKYICSAKCPMESDDSEDFKNRCSISKLLLRRVILRIWKKSQL